VLVLTRRPSEAIIIANNIKITVVSVGPGRVKLGIEAPPNVRVDRKEIHDKLEQAADVLSAVAGGEVAREGAGDAQNTMIGTGPDTATIILSTPQEGAAPAPDARPDAGTAPGTVPGTATGAPPAQTPTAQATPPLPLNKHNKLRLPRKPR
jgi:carbon storage regulator